MKWLAFAVGLAGVIACVLMFAWPDPVAAPADEPEAARAPRRDSADAEIDPPVPTAAPAKHAPKSTPTPAPTERTAAIRGTVRHVSGDPIAHARVRLLELTLTTNPFGVEADVQAETTTDDGGRFAFSTIPAGANVIEAVAERTCRKRTDLTRDASDAPREIDFTLGPPTILFGSVRTDRPDAPCAAVIGVRADDGSPLVHTDTDENGDYRFDRLAAGVYAMIVAPARHRPIPRPGVRTASDRASRQDFTVFGGLRIAGQVTDAITGAAIPSAELIVRHRLGHDLRTRTGDGGTFEFGSVTADHTSIEARAPGYRAATIEINVDPDDRRDRIENVKLLRPAFVRGRVIDENGAPVAGAHVGRWRRFDQAALSGKFTITDEDGRFELPSFVASEPGASSRVYAVGPGRVAGGSRPFEEKVGHSIDGLLIRLTRGGSVKGQVVWEDGRPVARAWLYLVRDPRSKLETDRTFDERRLLADRNGNFQVDGVPPGRHRLVAGFGTSNRSVAGVVVKSGETTVVPVIEMKGGRIGGRVVDEQDRPLGRGQVLVRDVDGRRIVHSESINPDGTFLIEGLVDAQYQLAAATKAVPLGGASVRVGVGTLDAKLIAGRAPTATGRVTYRDGRPATRFELRFAREDTERPMASRPTTITDPDGRFAVPVPIALSGPKIAIARTADGVATTGVTTGEMRLVLEASGRLVGVVVDDFDRPVMNATVRIQRDLGYGDRAKTTSTGAFEFGGLPVGSYDVVTSAEGLVPSVETIEIVAGSGPHKKIVLGREGGGIALRVERAEGQGVEGARVSLRRRGVRNQLAVTAAYEAFAALAAGDPEFTRLRSADVYAFRARRDAWIRATDADGRWRRNRLAAATYRLRVAIERRRPIVRDVRVRIGETTRVTIRID